MSVPESRVMFHLRNEQCFVNNEKTGPLPSLTAVMWQFANDLVLCSEGKQVLYIMLSSQFVNNPVVSFHLTSF